MRAEYGAPIEAMRRDTAPRSGTPEYEAWQAKRAKDAATIKSSGQTGNRARLSAGQAQ
jgi:hypothetical protein